MDRLGKYINNLSEMIRIPTISYYEKDNSIPFVEFRNLLPSLFPHLYKVADVEIISGSILICWHGENKENKEPILLMNHHDVVSAQGCWEYDPFGAELYDNKLWGRGALDTKGGLWAMLQAADDMIEDGFVPTRDIYFFSSCNEETTFSGAKETSQVLLERGIHFDMILDEGGMIVYEPISGAKDTFAMIGCGERGCVDLEFVAKGKGGHASCPEKDTPLVRLGKFMAKADTSGIFKVDIEKPVLEMFRRMSSSVSGPLRFVYAHPIFFKPLLKFVMPLLSSTSRALVQTTLAFTMAKAAERCSIMPTEASVGCNMRFSHHQGYASSLEAVTKLAKKFDIETTVLDPGGETAISDYDCEQFRLIESSVANAFGQKIRSTPYIMTGCSDARFMSCLSENVYHFTPFVIENKQIDTIHGVNEYIGIDNLIPAVEFYKCLMK